MSLAIVEDTFRIRLGTERVKFGFKLSSTFVEKIKLKYVIVPTVWFLQLTLCPAVIRGYCSDLAFIQFICLI
jgi:hypothetical protein